MLEKKGKCTNFGNCDIADKREEITISEGEEFICTECEKDLTEIVQPTKIPKTLISLLSLIMAIIINFYLS